MSRRLEIGSRNGGFARATYARGAVWRDNDYGPRDLTRPGGASLKGWRTP